MLNDSQKRRVSVTLSSFEEDLHNMERLLESADYVGVVHEMENDIPAPARKALIDTIDGIKNRIQTLVKRFDIERDRRSLRRQLFARLIYNWTTLEEIKTKHLRGYGAVAQVLKQTLDPELDAIIGLIREMERLLQTAES